MKNEYSMKEISKNIKTYEVDNNYLVYIIEDKDNWHCYLQHKDYGIIMLMFGLSNKYITLEALIEIIKNNLAREIKFYKEKYED